MADEANTISENSGKKEKTFTLKATIIFMFIMVLHTAVLFYFFKGDNGKATYDESANNVINYKLFSRLVLEQSQIPTIRISDVVVQIKLDKNGDTSRMLSCGFAFHLGLTLKEQKAIDENKWPPLLENTRFNQGNITEEQYTNPEWSLKNQILGKTEAGGDHGGASDKAAASPNSYVSLLTSMQDELKAKILDTLGQTTFSQINTQDGKNQICEQLKNEANTMLKSLGKYPRVYKVSIISFTFNQ